MIDKKYYGTRPDGVELWQRWSTLKVKIRQIETGKAYDDPIDIEPCPYTYEETDIPIDEEELTDIETEQNTALDYLTKKADNEKEVIGGEF